MQETITWNDTAKGLPEKSGLYLVTVVPGTIAHVRLDLNCANCVERWKACYMSWAEPPKGWGPGV